MRKSYQGKYQYFFYTKDGWKQQAIGGDAGTIIISTNKGTHLYNGSQHYPS
ncbi:hypothetical protein QUF74_19885 [Candidatus Halobeggiatoa sp. HSG11]|nr:hypothetical protein [Candidatus Halobeggiatoa sp. HSG11]